jgi:hypothetical protein
VVLRLAGVDLATDRLQAPGRFFTDAGKAFLGRHQLLLHQRDLLKAPPAQPGQAMNEAPSNAHSGPLLRGCAAFWRLRDMGRQQSSSSKVPRAGRHVVEIVASLRMGAFNRCGSKEA